MKQAENLKGCQGARGGLFYPGNDAEKILGEQYDETFYATSCAYLLRRFGPSRRGCDPYKDLVQYILTTSMEGVFLLVTPCCSVGTSFGYYLSPKIYKVTMDAMFESRKSKSNVDETKCPCRGPVIKALCDAIIELKKPVYVRDWYFNIVGRVRDEELQYDEEKEETVGTVEYSELAGYGITPDYFDKFKEDK